MPARIVAATTNGLMIHARASDTDRVRAHGDVLQHQFGGQHGGERGRLYVHDVSLARRQEDARGHTAFVALNVCYRGGDDGAYMPQGEIVSFWNARGVDYACRPDSCSPSQTGPESKTLAVVHVRSLLRVLVLK
jgi:hypothetical protein